MTAGRPGWSELPVGLRAALADRLGAPVVSADAATTGFTRGFAGVLTAADGARVFVKAAPATSYLADWYARDAAILDRLPPGLPVPRPRWTLHDSGWFALGQSVIDGRQPRHPWDPVELAATLAAYADVAAALADPPGDLAALGLPHLTDLARNDILRWGDVVAGREPTPPLPAHLVRRLPELVALESRLPAYAADASGLIHGDLRPDNVLLDVAGRVWWCDWTWLCHGPAWFDLVTLLLGGYAETEEVLLGGPGVLLAEPDVPAGGPGPALDDVVVAGGSSDAALDSGATFDGPHAAAIGPDAAFLGPDGDGPDGDALDAAFEAHPAAAGAPPDALDVTLAALAGYFLTTASVTTPTATAQLAVHQQRSGGRALAWLARRQGWG
ncbi:aminoglycoside phosphotransferase family protein [Micromonospora sp. WMMA1363]|uniref:aminoglycoside phosphotransferase family protein n=1 Tax=Micromonospora sp. WMMA1363 TaxID=3053985 RepID=UPI00259CF5B9|nr:aminoglycoside phosphotransferase family protein [Micromonospora sp. WMMA1363]MDM4720302.1 aminoglycoside phosphotransferase family protein [Micromonospora sp. WMMA1363]